MNHAGSPKSDPAITAVVDRVLHACGPGRVLCLGAAPSVAVAAFRARAVDAQGETIHGPAFPALPFATASVDVVYLEAMPEGIGEAARGQAIQEVLRVASRAVVVRRPGRTRVDCERAWLAQACRKHPLHQVLVPYQELDWLRDEAPLLFEPLPIDLQATSSLAALAGGRDLHMDMLREPGRRSDAHVARYMFARQFIRSGDRVLDAACGLGYGAAILTDGTFAESVVGMDVDPDAVAYASRHYGCRRSRLSFQTLDLSNLRSLPASSVDAIVSFETLEHLPAPDEFLAACRRVLTPAGRVIGSVPNRWVDDTGRDPNPHHVTVFDRASVEALCRKHFFIEHTFGQTAGGGMKLHHAGRALWKAEADDTTDAEWWLIVGMREPATSTEPVRHGLLDASPDAPTNLLAFDRDYSQPWLVRAMVIIGQRTESETLLSELADATIATSDRRSADVGAALCVQAYRHLHRGALLPSDLRARLCDYVGFDSTVPHVRRWQISLRYVQALAALQEGDRPAAVVALEACALADPLVFSPHLATKTVAAAFLRGWIALQAHDVDTARRWWTTGVDGAEGALHRPWREFTLSRRSPALFGLREATLIVDVASQCAAGLALLEQHEGRPGLVASQIFESLQERIRRAGVPGMTPSVAGTGGPLLFSWSLLDHVADVTLREGRDDQIGAWAARFDGVFANALLLHPPAVADVTVPSGAAGRLRTAVGLHPDVWGRRGAAACVFTLAVDHVVTTTVVLDPHRNSSDRRWVAVTLDVPESQTGSHVITLMTTADSPAHGWALFRDVIFDAEA